MHTPTDIIRPETLSKRQYEALVEIARRYDWELVVLFGSMARGEVARDIDLAVKPLAAPDLFTEGRWFRKLEAILSPASPDLLVLSDATSPVVRFEVFRDGVCLYQALPGAFDREQDRAFFLYADSHWLRRDERRVGGDV